MSLSFPDLMADLIARIEAGTPPWRQPWANSADPTLPLRSNGEPFTGSNAWLLAFAGALRGYTSPYWFTFKQALEIGAPVRKGAKAAPAILYKPRIVGDEAGEGEEARDAKVVRYMKTYAVFSAHDLTDCPEPYLAAPKVAPEIRAASRNAVLDAIPAQIEFGGSRAAYVPSADLIRLPPPEAFESPDDFLATLAHEEVHWSGAPHRLNRAFGKRFGDEAYAFEELVAEIAACALGLQIGLRPQLLDGHAAYLAHWAKLLKARPNALMEASGHAQRAVDYLLAFSTPEFMAANAGEAGHG
jgi:antirestriction protein ArdC